MFYLVGKEEKIVNQTRLVVGILIIVEPNWIEAWIGCGCGCGWMMAFVLNCRRSEGREIAKP
jgi:hypothetical protein